MAGRALITGAGNGIGAVVAERLAKDGWKVALVDLDLEGVEATAKRCGPDAIALQADITDQASVEAAASAAVDRFGGLDLCFANAGIATEGTLRNTTPETFQVQVDVNLVGTFRTIRACLPHLEDSKGYALINASASSIGAPPGLGAYGASKAAVESLGDTLRREVKHLGVDVGVVYLLFVSTDMVEGAESHGEIFRTMRASFMAPLRKPITPERAADAIVKGVGRRSRRIVAPRLVTALYRMRGLAPSVLERDMVKMAPEVEAASQRELAAKGQNAGVRTDTAATRAAADQMEAKR